MIACYCRVSSSQQKADSQQAAIQQWLKGNRLPATAVRWFVDTETGTTLQRPAFAALQQAIFHGEVDTVVVWKLDRLSRKTQEGINVLADWCERKVRVVSVTQQIDLRGSVGRLLASVLFGLAEIERDYLRERQAAGIAVAKGKGVYTGRKPGTTKSQPERAWALRAQHLTKPEIARALGVSAQTVWRYLKQRPSPPNTMKVLLYLAIENNNKFVRGKNNFRAEIERSVLSRYQMEKLSPEGWEYHLTIPYGTDEELERIIYEDILREAERIADSRHGFIEVDVRSVEDPDRSW
jgi:DNA invertase Pin-like site-specific DNA recombinase